MIIDGKTGFKNGAILKEYTRTRIGLRFENGSTLGADVVVFYHRTWPLPR